MVKVCARPACGAEATARFFFDAANRLVILDARIAEWGGSGVLCEDHADRLTPPRGWAIDDRRVLTPRLFPVGRFETADRPVPRPPHRAATPSPAGSSARSTAGAVADTSPATEAGTRDEVDSAVDTGALGADDAPTLARAGAPVGRTRRFATPAAHPSTPLPLDGGPSYALPEEYLAGEVPPARPAQPDPARAPERITETATPDTPLLSRAFDAARSKVRPTSTLDVLIPHAG